MAGVPVAAVVSVALLEADRAREIALELHAGIEAMAREFGVALAGGDTNAWDGPLVVSITLLGETTPRGGPGHDAPARPARRHDHLVTRPARREPARPPSRPSPAHRRGPGAPRSGRPARDDRPIGWPRQRLAPYPRRERRTRRRARRGRHPDPSGRFDSRGPARPCPRRRRGFPETLSDGRPRRCRTACLNASPRGVLLHRIGMIDDGPGLRLRHADGRVTPCPVRGFDHLA